MLLALSHKEKLFKINTCKDDDGLWKSQCTKVTELDRSSDS